MAMTSFADPRTESLPSITHKRVHSCRKQGPIVPIAWAFMSGSSVNDLLPDVMECVEVMERAGFQDQMLPPGALEFGDSSLRGDERRATRRGRRRRRPYTC